MDMKLCMKEPENRCNFRLTWFIKVFTSWVTFYFDFLAIQGYKNSNVVLIWH